MAEAINVHDYDARDLFPRHFFELSDSSDVDIQTQPPSPFPNKPDCSAVEDLDNGTLSFNSETFDHMDQSEHNHDFQLPTPTSHNFHPLDSTDYNFQLPDSIHSDFHLPSSSSNPYNFQTPLLTTSSFQTTLLNLQTTHSNFQPPPFPTLTVHTRPPTTTTTGHSSTKPQTYGEANHKSETFDQKPKRAKRSRYHSRPSHFKLRNQL